MRVAFLLAHVLSGGRIGIATARLEDWRDIVMRYTRCGDLFSSATALAAAVNIWL